MKNERLAVCALSGSLWVHALLGPMGAIGLAQAQASTPLPGSLDALYPPQSNAPVWLQSMLGMGAAFSGMVGDFLEGDFTNADKGFSDFQLQYGNLAGMVPEWKGDFPAEPIEALGLALQSREPARFMSAVDQASKVCHSCHVKNMTRVQQRYHWGDFAGIILTDPVSKGDVPFPVFMQMLDGDLSGVATDLTQGQVDQAGRHAEALAARFDTLKESCGACHDTERSYYVDAGVTGMIGKLGVSLKEPVPDPAGVMKLVQGIGMESCHKCHLVHGPAALAAYEGGLGH